MGRRLGLLSAALFGCGIIGACVGEDAGGTTGAGADGGGIEVDGALAPDGGAATGAFGLSIPTGKLTLTHGKTARVPVTIDRKGFDGAITVKIEGTPPGITSKTAAVPPGATTADVELVIDASSKQGDVAGMSVFASDESGKRTATLPLTAFVRGAPGEIDTTFGVNGVVTLPTSPNGLETCSDGAGNIYVNDGERVRRFGRDGALDTTFGDGGTATLQDSSQRLPAAIETVGTAVLAATHSGIVPYVHKLSAAGKYDTTYGNAGVTTYITGHSLGIAVGDDGSSALYSFSMSQGATRYSLVAFDAKGARTATGGGATPSLIRSAVLFDGSLVAVGDGGVIVKFKPDLTLDTSFASGTGYRVVDPGIVLHDVIRDAQGRFVVSGLSAANALVLARVTADGAMDSTLPLVTSSFATKPVPRPRCDGALEQTCLQLPSAGKLALEADGSILQAAQVDEQGATRCVVARYDASGKVDTAFGANGKAVLPIPGCVARRIHTQPDGRIILGGPLIVRVWN